MNSQFRVLWQVIHFALLDEETQKNGIVLIIHEPSCNSIGNLPYRGEVQYASGQSENESEYLSSNIEVLNAATFFKGMPVKVRAVHCCTSHKYTNDESILWHVGGTYLLPRLCVHRSKFSYLFLLSELLFQEF